MSVFAVLYVALGNQIEYTNPSSTVAVASGTGVALGGLLGVATDVIAASAQGALQTEGVYDLDNNATPITYAVGDRVKFDVALQTTSTAAVSATILDCATCIVAGSGAKVRVKLNTPK